jgi:hypothetical protein
MTGLWGAGYILLLLEFIPQLKHLDLHLPLPIMLQDLLIRLSLPMLKVLFISVLEAWLGAVAMA